MREKNAVLRGYGLVGCLAAVTLAGTLSACGGGPAPVQSSPGASCSNYPLHGAGSYHNEASIHVEVSNATSHPARYAIDVTLTAAKDASGAAPSMHVTIHGSLGSHASGELGRKVLTADLIQRCQVTSITRQSES
jgi:hypothetical protein